MGRTGLGVWVRGRGAGRVQAVAGVELRSIRLVGAGPHRDEGFEARMLDRHLDFVRGLRELVRGVTLELRYLRPPGEPHRVRVAMLVRAEAAGERTARAQARRVASAALDLLAVHHPDHRFEPVTGEGPLRRLADPFRVRDLVEIVRREEMLALDTVRPRDEAAVGFVTRPAASGPGKEGELPRIYYAYPFAVSFDTMERLCRALLLAPGPVLLSVCIRPHALGPDELAGLEERIRMCETFRQLPPPAQPDPGLAEPLLKWRAEALLAQCSRELLALQDAAFRMAVRMAASGRVPDALVAVAGATLTEHAGHPFPVLQDAADRTLVGGYRAVRPPGEGARVRALDNLAWGGFEAWVPGPQGGEAPPWRDLFPVGQVCAAFRLPLATGGEFPGIDTVLHTPRPAPTDLPDQGVLLGVHRAPDGVRPVRCPLEDRRRHMYVVGQTGTGKSTLFLGMILQDLRAGHGLGLIDPHGELVDEVLACVPPEREADVICLDPTDLERPVGINLLEAPTPLEKDFCINYLMDVFDLLYNLMETGGPIFEMYMRNALYLLLHQPPAFRPAVVDVPPVFQRLEFRKALLDTCTNPYVVDFWTKEAERTTGDIGLKNVAPYITSKLSRFIYNEVVRGIVGQRRSTIDFRRVMDEGKVLLVDLRKGLLGSINSHFLGMMVVGKLFAAALGRRPGRGGRGPRDFYLYVDEFHNLATPTFVSILSEARKYRLALVLTNQYVAQLPPYVVQGILGNVGTLVSLRVGSADADLLRHAFGDVVSAGDLQGLPNWHAYVRLLARGRVSAAFDMATVLPARRPLKARADRIRRRSGALYGCPRQQVEAQIRAGLEWPPGDGQRPRPGPEPEPGADLSLSRLLFDEE